MEKATSRPRNVWGFGSCKIIGHFQSTSLCGSPSRNQTTGPTTSPLHGGVALPTAVWAGIIQALFLALPGGAKIYQMLAVFLLFSWNGYRGNGCNDLTDDNVTDIPGDAESARPRKFRFVIKNHKTKKRTKKPIEHYVCCEGPEMYQDFERSCCSQPYYVYRFFKAYRRVVPSAPGIKFLRALAPNNDKKCCTAARFERCCRSSFGRSETRNRPRDGRIPA